MASLNNILNIKINQLGSAGFLNHGNTLNLGATSEIKVLGGSSPIGDFPRNIDFERNIYLDPDVVDQGELASI